MNYCVQLIDATYAAVDYFIWYTEPVSTLELCKRERYFKNIIAKEGIKTIQNQTINYLSIPTRKTGNRRLFSSRQFGKPKPQRN